MNNPVLADIDVGRLRRHVIDITEQFPTRLAGSENGRRMADYSANALRTEGIDARVDEFPGLVSFPEAAEFRVLSPTGFSLEASTLGHSVPGERIRGLLVDTGSGADNEFGADWREGCIALSELSYNPARQEKERIAAARGATACVMMNWGSDDNPAIPFGSVKAAWGNPTPGPMRSEMPTVPCIGLSRKDGMALRDMLRAGPVEVELSARVTNDWCPVQMTIAEIPGSTSETIIVGGHQDSWQGPQATDNATGSACLLELARIFNLHRDKLKRGLTFGFWVGHETGTMIGSSRFADQNWDRLRRDAVAYLQIDQPGCLGTTCWHTMSNPEMRRFHETVEAGTVPTIERRWSRAMKVGDSSFFGMGIPMFAGQGAYTREELCRTANASFGWWHHSIHNTIDKVEWDFLEAHMRTYAEYLWALCTLPVLPFEFMSVSDEIVARLRELSVLGTGVDLETSIGLALTLRAGAEKLDDAALMLARLAAAGESANSKIATVNACLKSLSRALVPLASTRIGTYGHDPYGITAQTTALPLLYEMSQLGEGGLSGSARAMVEIEVLRARNRVTDTLRSAVAYVEDTLSSLNLPTH